MTPIASPKVNDNITTLMAEPSDRLAVIADGVSISYAELHHRADKVASYLLDKRINSGDVICILGDRCVDTIATMVGVLKSGAAYKVVELEENGQLSTLSGADTDADYVIQVIPDIQGAIKRQSNWLRLEDIYAETLPQVVAPVRNIDPAYIVSTSGTTGKSKGVVVNHGNIRHYVTSMLSRLNMEACCHYAHVSSLSADLGNTSVYLSLCTGGTLHLINNDIRRNPDAFFQYLSKESVDIIKITPSHWSALFADTHIPVQNRKLKYLVFGGEPLATSIVRDAFTKNIASNIVNHYGPSETTIGVLVNVINENDENAYNGASVPIGTPLGGTKIYVQNASGEVNSRNATGELLIGGPSVTTGYLNDPDETSKKFIFLEQEKAQRLYRSGDIVHVDNNGVVTFQGRVDRQVKINGYRVELESVERKVKEILGVKHAHLEFLEVRGRKSLILALLDKEYTVASGVIKILRANLPPHMIPSRVIKVDEFPITSNGKIDTKTLVNTIVRQLNTETENVLVFAGGADNQVAVDIIGVWGKYLLNQVVDVNADFFDLGGDSVSAIQVISDLQKKGYPISADDFMKAPTVRGVERAISNNLAEHEQDRTLSRRLDSRCFSAAQTWFFDNEFSNKDHWNQVLLYESVQDVNVELLGEAVSAVVNAHPLLRTRYYRVGQDWAAACCDIVDVFSYSDHNGSSDTNIEKEIYSRSAEINRNIRLETGEVFKVHLFKFNDANDQLLFVCHHLSIDAVSWRIVVSDIAYVYSALKTGSEYGLPAQKYTYWDWVENINENMSRFIETREYWKGLVTLESSRVTKNTEAANTESLAHTAWAVLSPSQYVELKDVVSARLNTTPDVVLLGVFLTVTSRFFKMNDVYCDVESYGRTSFNTNMDLSRTVGWFTSTFPVHLRADQRSIAENIKTINKFLRSIPSLGVSYAYVSRQENGATASVERPPLSFNYLGEFRNVTEGGVEWRPSSYRLSAGRGASNSRVHELKLTARVVNDNLIIDLSYSTGQYLDNMMDDYLKGIVHELQAIIGNVGNDAAKQVRFLLEKGSSSGALASYPCLIHAGGLSAKYKKYRSVLLTGATGYIGIHVLRSLLLATDAVVYCLVRGGLAEKASKRLFATYKWYFDNEDLSNHSDRIVVICGDAAKENFGLEERQISYLSGVVDAIYNFAADTRLFGSSEAIEHNNYEAVKTVIRLASTLKNKDIHHMSTLAVSGVYKGDGEVVFSERNLDVGQVFQNAYELSKYRSEVLLNEYAGQGGHVFIYRSGNVSAHSETGKFQYNADQNRFVQFLRAMALVGKVPSNVEETICLVPVDHVADALVQLSLTQPASTGGVYHVDTSHELKMRDIFNVLTYYGIRIEDSKESNFRDLMVKHGDNSDPVIALGTFWASRENKKIRYDHKATERLLESIGYVAKPITMEWFGKFVEGLIERGIIVGSSDQTLESKSGWPSLNINNRSVLQVSE